MAPAEDDDLHQDVRLLRQIIGKPDVTPQAAPGCPVDMGWDPELYLNISGFAKELGLTPDSMSARYVSGKLPDPDVIVGKVIRDCLAYPGWSQERMVLYKDYVSQFTSRKPRINIAQAQLLPWWNIEVPRFYLTVAEAAQVLHLKRISLTLRLQRGTFPVRPAVLLGLDTFGWDGLEVHDYGVQAEQIWPDGTLRTGSRQPGARRHAELALLAQAA